MWRANAIVAVVLALSTVARADTPRPWADGVSEEQQARAIALFEEANELHAKPLYREARAKYEEALIHWDHPAIRYNLVLVLVRTEQPLEAFEHLKAALRFGDAPLEPAEYEQALLLQRTLERQVVSLVVTCDQPGTRVMLDGKLLFAGPDRREVNVLVGEHTVSASAPGYVSRTDTLVVPPGKPYVVELQLMTIEESTIYERRWAWWKPWAVAASGGVFVLVGIPLQLQGRSNLDRYNQAVDVLCNSGGCAPGTLPSAVEDLRGRGRWYGRAAIGAFVVGGAGIALGVGLAVVNRPRAVAPSESALSIRPVIDGSTAGFLATLPF